MVTEAAGDGHHGAEAEATEAVEGGDTDGETVEEETSPVSANTDKDGGSNGLAVAGLVAGLLGVGLGGAAFARTRRSA